MKSVNEWVEVHKDLSVYHDQPEAIRQFIATIQRDAFESGRVAGRKYELDRVASILRDSGKPEMVAMAFSCERLSAGISQPTPTPPDNQKGGS